MLLDVFFRPQSVAVIGASRDPESMSGTLVRNLLDSFHRPLYLINPRVAQIAGRPTHRSILEVPEPVDLAFVAVPVGHVLETVDQCLEKQVRGLVVISAGFAEVGEAGRQLELELRERLARAGVPFVGPNCLGVLNNDPHAPLNGTFSLAAPPFGNVAVCTQSGALGFVFPDYMRRWRLGVARLLSLGNKGGVGENDVLEAWAHDPGVAVIQLYLESFQDPRQFVRVARRAALLKPVIVLKAGRGAAGQRAAGSHTAALASPTALADGALRQAGAIVARDMAELFEATALVALQPLPFGRRVAVLTNAGGPGVLCADTLEAQGLVVPEFSTALRQRLQRHLPPQAAVGNPVDLIGSTSPQEYRECLAELLDSEEIDNVVVIYVPRLAGTAPAIAQAVVETVAAYRARPTKDTSRSQRLKPVVGVFMESEGTPEDLITDQASIPAFLFPESAARALGCVVKYAEWRERHREWTHNPRQLTDSAREAIAQVLAAEPTDPHSDSGNWLDPTPTHALLRAAGIEHPRWSIARSAEEAAALAEQLGLPVTLKTLAASVLHKARVGGVVNDCRNRAEVMQAYQQVTTRASDSVGALVQQFVRGGRELFVGLRRDPRHGLVLGCGPGGSDVESTRGVWFRHLPAATGDLDDLLEETGIVERFPTEDRPRVRRAVTELLERIAELAELTGALTEADFNPILVFPDGRCSAVDVRVHLR